SGSQSFPRCRLRREADRSSLRVISPMH
ncbi:CTP synthase, partial [Chlamydia psittaci 09DC78]